jgi:hypothetical protein
MDYVLVHGGFRRSGPPSPREVARSVRRSGPPIPRHVAHPSERSDAGGVDSRCSGVG